MGFWAISLWQFTCTFRLLQPHFMYVNMLVTQSCPTLCDPMDCSPPGSVHEILMARILEWVAISFFRGSAQPRD